MSYGKAKKFGPNGCQVPMGNGTCGETKTLNILNEFKTLYEKRMEQLDNETRAGGDCSQAKIHLQEQWIKDLMEQNEMMARAVEQLEIEATERVQMLEEKLQSSARCICEVMKRYREYSSSLDLDEPFQKMYYVENDLKNLLEFIRRIREDKCWSIEGLQFYDITYKDLFGDCKPCTKLDCPPLNTERFTDGNRNEKVGKSLRVSFEIVGSEVRLQDNKPFPCPYPSQDQPSPRLPKPCLPCICCPSQDISSKPCVRYPCCSSGNPPECPSSTKACVPCSCCPSQNPPRCLQSPKPCTCCPDEKRPRCPGPRSPKRSPCSCCRKKS